MLPRVRPRWSSAGGGRAQRRCASEDGGGQLQPPALQYLLGRGLGFALELGNGLVTSRVFLEPGTGFVDGLQQTFRTLRAEARRAERPEERRARRIAQWKAMFTFVPLGRRLRGREQRPADRPRAIGNAAPAFAFQPPPFLLALTAPMETTDGQHDPDLL